jgi:hypothetical protein
MKIKYTKLNADNCASCLEILKNNINITLIQNHNIHKYHDGYNIHRHKFLITK